MIAELVLAFLLQNPPATRRSFLAFTHDGVNTTKYQACIDALPCVDLIRASRPDIPAGEIWMNFPAVTPGDHTATVVACNDTVCSDPSNVATFKFVAIPNNINDLKIVVK